MIAKTFLLIGRSDPNSGLEAIYGLIENLNVELGYDIHQRNETFTNNLITIEFATSSTPELAARAYFDNEIDSIYLTISTENEPQMELVERVVGTIPIEEFEALENRAVQDLTSRSILRLTIGHNGKVSGTSLSIYRKALISENHDIRRAAAMSASILKWKELKDDINIALSKERDDTVKLALLEALNVIN